LQGPSALRFLFLFLLLQKAQTYRARPFRASLNHWVFCWALRSELAFEGEEREKEISTHLGWLELGGGGFSGFWKLFVEGENDGERT
jgi:hypothetical protein